jgi:outer membrane protein assembly factor BamA
MDMGDKGMGRLLRVWPWGSLLLLVLCVCGCNTKRYLAENEKFLRRNTITITTPGLPTRTRTALSEKLSLIIPIRERPNEYFLGAVPVRRWVFYKTDKAQKKFGKWLHNQLGEQPVLYDSLAVLNHVEDMRDMLASEGYFNTDITTQIAGSRRKAQVYYTIDVRRPLLIEKVDYITNDSTYGPYLPILEASSLLKPGLIFTQALYDSEKQRLARFFRNRGYYDFSPSDIKPVVVDTAVRPYRFVLEIRSAQDIEKPVYKFGQVHIVQSLKNRAETLVGDTMIEGRRHRYIDDNTAVSPSVLDKKITLVPGKLYRIEDVERTGQQLDNLSAFRFVNINLQPDTLLRLIDVEILLPPAKLMNLAGGLDFNFSTSTSVRNTVGGAFNGKFTHRNLLGGAELFQINTNAGVDFALRNRLRTSADVRVDGFLQFPQLKDATGLWRLAGRFRLINDAFLQEIQQRGQTTYGLGANFQRQQNIFSFYSANLSSGVQLKRARSSYSLQQLGLNLFLPIELEAYDSYVEGKEFLRRSLSPQLITGFLFHQLSVNRRFMLKNQSEPLKLAFRVEQSGLEFLGVNALVNTIRKTQVQPKVFNRVNFAQYVLGDIDVSHTIRVADRRSVAWRASSGLALNLAPDQRVPFLKQYFVGGPNSIRAWRIRGLGPGAHFDPVSSNPNSRVPAYQVGDLKFEFSGEYRFPLFWNVESALFLDGGNIWTLRS